jgi:glycerate 2-kinase
VSGTDIPPRRLLLRLFEAAVARANPIRCVPPHLPKRPPKGRTVVIGAGKAAAAMARAVEMHWPHELSGLVVTRDGHGVACDRIEVVEAGHPVPDERGALAARRILALIQGLSADDLVICLLSGGGSALVALPADGITLADKRVVTEALLRSGARIDEINAVRKHLSAIKGGKLAAAAYPAELLTLAISDVPGDDPAVIASGPTIADPTSFTDARAVLARYDIAVPAAVDALFRAAKDETPKPGDPRLARARTIIVARPQDSLEAAAAVARAAGLKPVILGDSLEGEARQSAIVHAGIARQVTRHGQPAAAPAVLLSGGETTVTVRGKGRGGRNAEFVLGLALALGGALHIHAIACDTDGIDGTEDNAGALIGPDTLERARALGLDPAAALADNDAHAIFKALDDLVVTGPTRTNVNDFRAILVTKKE